MIEMTFVRKAGSSCLANTVCTTAEDDSLCSTSKLELYYENQDDLLISQQVCSTGLTHQGRQQVRLLTVYGIGEKLFQWLFYQGYFMVKAEEPLQSPSAVQTLPDFSAICGVLTRLTKPINFYWNHQ